MINDVLTRYRYILFSLIASALVGAVGYGLSHRPPSVTLTVLPPPPTPLPTSTPTAAPVIFHIVGQVNAPGVYSVPPGSRVQDAIQAAAGPTDDADLERLDLAAIIQDEQQIVVPGRQTAPSRGPSDALEETGSELIDVNTADNETLQTLPGIGPVLADRIIDYRDEHGPFATIDDLIAVKGIGEATLEKLRPLITVGP